jgi:protein-tyrosine phosphatase
MGNICRSPTAEGVLRHRAAALDEVLDIQIDSAGTHGYHAGSPPDPRAVSAAARRGIDISGQRARTVETTDFQRFDLILAMDEDNLEALKAMRPANCRADLQLFLSFCSDFEIRSVPDPYYGGSAGFERVLDIIEDASHSLLEELRRSF